MQSIPFGILGAVRFVCEDPAACVSDDLLQRLSHGLAIPYSVSRPPSVAEAKFFLHKMHAVFVLVGTRNFSCKGVYGINRSARVIMVPALVPAPLRLKDLHAKFEECWSLGMLHVTAILPAEEPSGGPGRGTAPSPAFQLFTYFPFRPGGHCKDTSPVPLTKPQHPCSPLDPKLPECNEYKLKDLHGCELLVGTMVHFPFVASVTRANASSRCVRRFMRLLHYQLSLILSEILVGTVSKDS